MAEQYIKMKTMREYMEMLSEKPSVETIEALVNTCDDKSGFYPWDNYGNPDKVTIKASDMLTSMCIDAFYNDYTDIFDILNMPENYGNSNLSICYHTLSNRLFPHIITAIINHTHTETITRIFAPGAAFTGFLSDKIFKTALYSENYPITKHLQEIAPFEISAENIEYLMKNKKYEQLDMLLDNGKYLRQSELIRNIICNAANEKKPKMLTWIDFLAKRYGGPTDGNEKAKSDFIFSNSDIDKVISYIVYRHIDGINYPGLEIVLDYFIKNNLKLSDMSQTIATSSLTNHDEFLENGLIKLMDENSYICYENIISTQPGYNSKNLGPLIRALSKELPYRIKLSILKETSALTVYDTAPLKELLKLCEVEPVDNIPEHSVIDDIINKGKSRILRSFLDSGVLSQKAIEETVDMCTLHRSYNCLNEINKYCNNQT